MQAKQKALCVATRCATADQFVATFHKFCDDSSFFVATMAQRPVGLETAFSIQLEDKTPVLRGLCTVVEAWATPANRFGRPGVRLAVKRLTADSVDVFKQLQAARAASDVKPPPLPLPQPPPVPRPAQPPPRAVTIPPKPQTPSQPLPVVPKAAIIESERPVRAEGTGSTTAAPPVRDSAPAVRDSAPPVRDSAPVLAPPDESAPTAISADELTTPVASETRAPGSSYVLPANPLMNLTDASLEGFVDCALYEETGNFFRAAEDAGSLVDLDDAIAEPPPPVIRPVPALSPTAFVRPSEREEEYVPDPTPIPSLMTMPPPPRLATDPVAIATGAVARPTPPPLPAPPPTPPPRPIHRPPVDSTASILAMARGGNRRRWLIIGGAAAGTSLLLLVIVLASGGGSDAKTANAATPSASKAAAAAAPPASSADTSGTPAIATSPKPAPVERAPAPPPVDKTVDPDEAAAASADPNAPPVVGSGPCKVTVTTSPAGSIVSIDDTQMGPSPITIQSTCAKRRVDVKHPRYALGTKWVTLEAGKPSTVDVTLARPTHTLTVTSTPSGATVSISGRSAGTTPTAVKIMGFSGVSITVEKKGFKPVTQKLYSKVELDKLSVKLVRGK